MKLFSILLFLEIVVYILALGCFFFHYNEFLPLLAFFCLLLLIGILGKIIMIWVGLIAIAFGVKLGT